ncbi:MAG: VWA domain-containing protein [Armatimonadetes bacterium]|nr:VWA domain-containing protein [Armatimonadota bacterium]
MWDRLSNLLCARRRRPQKDASLDADPITPEFARLMQAAFPLSTAPGALRVRVARICQTGSAVARRAAASRAARWHRTIGLSYRLVPFAAVGLLLVWSLWSSEKRSGSAYAEEAPTAGQLTIVDDKGKAIGLCPLKHTDVIADIAGFVARVQLRQEFHNPTEAPVEAVYTFPLPEDAAVDEMTMSIGSRVIRGEIKRREEAREIYEAARAAGQAAALLDQERPNIFTQSVANIMPGERVTVVISYVNLLKYDEGEYEFTFPMVVGPRFTPGGGYTVPGQRGDPSPPQAIEGDPGATSVVTDADRITPPITPPATRTGHNISVTVNLDAGLPVQDVRSQLHPIATEASGPTRRIIRLQNQDTLPNKDFVLRYAVAGSEIQTGVLAHAVGDGFGYFTLILQPPQAPPQSQVSAKEMVFVIDQSGSQMGWPIRKAKETMRYCIRHLNPGDTFQLIGFNLNLNPCFPAPVPNTPENVAKAMRFLEPLEGEGGTDILRAVDYALRLPDDPERLRMICYMTDGYVGNDMQIIAYVRKHRGRARMFPFGIGNSVNRFLIEGMAKEGRGVAELVTLNTPGEEAAARFYRRVSHPLLLDVGVDWHGLPVDEVYPKHLPDLFSARPLILKGRYTRAAEGDITVHGLLRGRPWSQTIHVSFPSVQQENSALPTLWAREKIEALQSQDWLGAQLGRPDPKVQEQIVATALEYRLMSQYTSFVAVEERIVNVGGRQRTVDVPVEMPEGVSYEGIFGDESAEAARLLEAKEMRLSHNIVTDAGGWAGAPGGMGGAPASPPAATAAPFSPAATLAPRGVRPPGPSPVKLRRLPRITGQLNVGFRANRQADAVFDLDVPATSGEMEIAAGTPEGLKRLEAMKPEQRRALLARAKLAPPLQRLAEQVCKHGVNGSLRQPGLPEVVNGRVGVQIWLNELPPDGLKQLQALGFELAATLRPGKLLLGTLSVERLEALIALPFVRRVEPPRFK